jgi:glycosyltransferase involved in cell wall biosynthesis
MAGGGRLRRYGERVVRGLAARLPPERGEALLLAGKAGYALLTGERPRRGVVPRREPRINPVALRSVESAMESGELSRALELIDGLRRRYPDSTHVLRLQREVLSRTGELTKLAATLHRMHTIDQQPEWRSAERGALGRILETTPGWLPAVPGPARPVVPDGDDVVLHLLKESSPHLTTGFTMRSRYNLLATQAAGIRPVVVTALGFPRLLGVKSIARLEVVDGIPHHRLDLGPNYPLDGPVDQLLADTAWQVADLAQHVRPALIHASSGHRGFELALVGAAVRAHIRRPMVYEVRSFFETTWQRDEGLQELGETYQRRFDTETRTMQAADHVITIAESMRAELIERGVEPDRITVVPNGVDADVFQPEPADPALRARYGTDGAFTFGYVSNLDHARENQELLIDATRILLDRGRAVRCLIIGDGKRRGEVEDYARGAGVGRSVVFTGRVPHDEVRGHYALLDAFVVPRKDERAARMVTPLKPYEALAMAKPLVVADLPALLEIAEPDERGLAFPTGDAAGLVAALERLMDDPALGQRLGERGRAWVARERRWSDNGPRFREVYRRVLEEWSDRQAGAG